MRRRLIRYALVAFAAAALLAAGTVPYMSYVMNPAVERELRENPRGERAQKVMLLTLPGGRTLPVNYLREGDTVYVGCDGRWWRELRGPGARVALLVRGEVLSGHARAIEDDPAHRSAVFDRLRPSAPEIFGTLIQIELTPGPRKEARVGEGWGRLVGSRSSG